MLDLISVSIPSSLKNRGGSDMKGFSHNRQNIC